MREADVIVANHDLVLSDVFLGGGMVRVLLHVADEQGRPGERTTSETADLAAERHKNAALLLIQRRWRDHCACEPAASPPYREALTPALRDARRAPHPPAGPVPYAPVPVGLPVQHLLRGHA